MIRAWLLSGIACCVAVAAWGGGALAEEAKGGAGEWSQRASAELTKADGDGDGRLTPEEFLAARPVKEHAASRQRFVACDFDGDGKLDVAELRAAIAPTDERGTVPDPLAEREQAALAACGALLKESDHDADGALSRAEWPAKQIATRVSELAEVDFDLWDGNRDGRVDLDEMRRLLEAAYGLAQLDGRPLRTPTGRVFSWYYYRHLDENGDGEISADEFVSRHHSGAEKNAAIFHELDADGDERLSEMETWRLLWHDTLANFLDYDRDRDGYLTTDEFLAIGWGTTVARHCVRAFDQDGDGKVSYREFRGTPFANQASAWSAARRDGDDDGRLSWREFYTEKPPLLLAQGRWMFDHLDIDKDGGLTLGELEFDVNPDKVPADALFAARDTDGDGKLVFKEVFTERRPAAGDEREAERYEARLAAAENRFLSDDKDSSGFLDLAEFSESQAAAIEAARRHSAVLSNQKILREGNYYVRKGVLIVNEIAFLAIVWLVVRKAGKAAPEEPTNNEG